MTNLEFITTLCNLPLLEKALLLGGSFFFILTMIWLIRSYLSRLDRSYISVLSELASHNRIQAAKAGHVALHELSFSWFRGVRMIVKTLKKSRSSTGTR